MENSIKDAVQRFCLETICARTDSVVEKLLKVVCSLETELIVKIQYEY